MSQMASKDEDIQIEIGQKPGSSASVEPQEPKTKKRRKKVVIGKYHEYC